MNTLVFLTQHKSDLLMHVSHEVFISNDYTKRLVQHFLDFAEEESCDKIDKHGALGLLNNFAFGNNLVRTSPKIKEMVSSFWETKVFRESDRMFVIQDDNWVYTYYLTTAKKL